ncbi:MAG: transglutaminase domain-containing protein [Bacteroidales bacterium]|nr:transglutaminase domain-containing protein [Bacteroidales bacterium]MBN2819563.1 transglutaminase domain-containing protein [Bacteroidales bacterium]
MPKKLLIILFLVGFLKGVSAQDKIHDFTLSIIDTTESEYFQASDIFNWITLNISYDTRAFKKLLFNNYSPEETLKRRKGLCFEYATLFSAMCQSVGIESYMINAYDKGIEYYKGKPIIRTKHSINVFYSDSTWHFVDATAGSGSIYACPNFYRKALQTFFDVPAAKTDFKFQVHQNYDYFDIITDKLPGKFYPLDPKWYQSQNPLSFFYFLNDSFPETVEYINYEEEIENVRFKDLTDFYRLEAFNGLKYNPNNYFDLGLAYSNCSNKYILDREINETNKWQFEKYLEDYDLISESFSKYLNIADSIYRIRKFELKKLNSDHGRLTKKIDTKAKSAKSSFRSVQERYWRKDFSYEKKQGNLLLKSERLKLRYLEPVYSFDSVAVDSAELAALFEEAMQFKPLEDSLTVLVDSLFDDIDNKFRRDAILDDSINYENFLFSRFINQLFYFVQKGDEDMIKIFVDSMQMAYSDIANLLLQKKGTKKVLQEEAGNYYSNSSQLLSGMSNQTTILKKLFQKGNYTDSIRTLHNQLLDKQINYYQQSMKYTRKLANHNNLQADFRKQNLRALKNQRKLIKREYKYFNVWNETLMSRETAWYEKDKEIAKQIKSQAQKNQRTVISKIKKYELQKEKHPSEKELQ